MGEQRKWDESRSPQWRYLLSKESAERREREKEEGAQMHKRVSKRKRLAQERHREKRKLKNKSGKEIVYSASPGGERYSFHDPDFVSRKMKKKTPNKIFTTDNDETI